MNANIENIADDRFGPARPGAVCIGSVHWDWIGTTPDCISDDAPGIIERRPGGVALNVATALNFFGVDTSIIGAVGADRDGEELIETLTQIGLGCELIVKIPDSPTDRYLAIENRRGLVAAVADTRTLEKAGKKVLDAYRSEFASGSLLEAAGIIVVDGNLPQSLLKELHRRQDASGSNTAIVCASSGKASRISIMAGLRNSTIYMNRREVCDLLGENLLDSRDAAEKLCRYGFKRAVVTDGAGAVAIATEFEMISCQPLEIDAVRVTGSGDVFVAAHISSELAGERADRALEKAVSVASSYVAGDFKY